MNEVWKLIEDYPEYEISNLARIRRIKGKHCLYGRIIKQQLNRGKYSMVFLSIKGNKHYKQVHRLLAKAFIPNPKNKPQINHKDSNRSNNSLSNLEWVTASENSLHYTKAGRNPLINSCKRLTLST